MQAQHLLAILRLITGFRLCVTGQLAYVYLLNFSKHVQDVDDCWRACSIFGTRSQSHACDVGNQPI